MRYEIGFGGLCPDNRRLTAQRELNLELSEGWHREPVSLRISRYPDESSLGGLQMSTSISLPVSSHASGSSFRFLGLVGMLCAPGMLIDAGVRYAKGDTGEGVIASSSIVGLFYLAGWTASMIGFRQLRLTGNGVIARIVFWVQMVGLTLAAGQQIMELIGTPAVLHSRFFGICDTAWPLSHLLMLVVGGMVLATGRVHAFARFAALGSGLALPATAALAPLNHYVFAFGFGVVTMLCFGQLGSTVYRAGTGREI